MQEEYVSEAEATVIWWIEKAHQPILYELLGKGVVQQLPL